MPRSLTLAQARAVLDAAAAEADRVGQPMNTAVVDDAGRLVAFAAMDGTKLVGEEISQAKAVTAVYFQLDTADLVPLVQPGGPLYGIEATGGGHLVVFPGGVLLRTADGALAGAVGVSAGTVEQDQQVALAAARAFPG